MSEFKKRKKPVYLQVYIGPSGLNWMTFRLSNKKPNPMSVTRGEGNCLVFRLVNGDYSPNFYKALEDGTIMEQIGDFTISANLDKLLKVTVPKEKKKMAKKIEQLRKEGRIS